VVIRVLLADDEPLVRAGIAMLLAADPEIEVAGEVGDGQAAVEFVQRSPPDVVVMDLRMPRMDGVEATRCITQYLEANPDPDRPGVQVLVLTTYNLDQAVYGALCAGAVGFLLKDAAPAELIAAIKAIAAGEGWLDPSITRSLIKQFAAQSGTDIPPAPAVVEAQARESVFRKEGEYWTVSYGGKVCRLRDSIGLHYLARLLQQPGQEFHVLDLVHAERGPVGAGGHKAGFDASGAGEQGLRIGLGHAGEILDETTKASYKRRIRDLQRDLEEAESWADAGRASKAREELEFLVDELARNLGLGGRDRLAASDAERARVSVTKAIIAAIKRMGAAHHPLARHLKASVHTGTFCSYSPEGSEETTWRC